MRTSKILQPRTSIKCFDFTLYTTIPHHKSKNRLTSIILNAFIFKNGNRSYKFLVLRHEETYFVKEHSGSGSESLIDVEKWPGGSFLQWAQFSMLHRQGTLTLQAPFVRVCIISDCWNKFSRIYTTVKTLIQNFTIAELRDVSI